MPGRARCHNACEKVKKADLDLSTHAAILKGGESGVPSSCRASPARVLLFEAVHEGRMPADKKSRLNAEQVESLRLWIESGALPEPGSAAAPAAASAATSAVTQHDVYPILLRRLCTVCHGRDVRENGLDLRTRASMLKGGRSGPAIVPSDPDASLPHQEGAGPRRCPRARRVIEVSIKPIEPAEGEVLARWISLGAPEAPVEPDVAGRGPDPLVTDKERDFWAFRPPTSPPVPRVLRPELARNAVDAFLLEKLDAAGLSFSPEADRRTLLRRLSLDLTGLTPEPADVDRFLGDTAPGACRAARRPAARLAPGTA